ncbi:MAG: hypothetical protein OHK0019_21080 [Saprospiraceae bacterium]
MRYKNKYDYETKKFYSFDFRRIDGAFGHLEIVPRSGRSGNSRRPLPSNLAGCDCTEAQRAGIADWDI